MQGFDENIGYLEISGVAFNNPSPLRETFRYAPELVQVGKSEVTAAGTLSTKILPHGRRKIWCEFPPLTFEQYQTYWNALHADSTGKGMRLNIRVYNELSGGYDSDMFYHNDIEVTPIAYGGQTMYKINAFELIGY